MHVFTYGTLMFPEVWPSVVGKSFETIHGRVDGYVVVRVEGAVFPGMTPAGDDAIARGVVYLDVDDASLDRLDRFQDDFYNRQAIPVSCEDGRQLLAAA